MAPFHTTCLEVQKNVAWKALRTMLARGHWFSHTGTSTRRVSRQRFTAILEMGDKQSKRGNVAASGRAW